MPITSVKTTNHTIMGRTFRARGRCFEMPLLRDSLLMPRIAPAAVLGSSDWSLVTMTVELGRLGDGWEWYDSTGAEISTAVWLQICSTSQHKSLMAV